jgi:hypothetical protein
MHLNIGEDVSTMMHICCTFSVHRPMFSLEKPVDSWLQPAVILALWLWERVWHHQFIFPVLTVLFPQPGLWLGAFCKCHMHLLWHDWIRCSTATNGRFWAGIILPSLLFGTATNLFIILWDCGTAKFKDPLPKTFSTRLSS